MGERKAALARQYIRWLLTNRLRVLVSAQSLRILLQLIAGKLGREVSRPWCCQENQLELWRAM